MRSRYMLWYLVAALVFILLLILATEEAEGHAGRDFLPEQPGATATPDPEPPPKRIWRWNGPIRHPDAPPLPLPCEATHSNPQVDRWADLVCKYFPRSEWATAMRVMHCESRGDPNALHPRSLASGLMQHLQKYWVERSAKAGWAGASVFDPEANVAVAAWLQATEGWRHWTCA